MRSTKLNTNARAVRFHPRDATAHLDHVLRVAQKDPELDLFVLPYGERALNVSSSEADVFHVNLKGLLSIHQLSAEVDLYSLKVSQVIKVHVALFLKES